MCSNYNISMKVVIIVLTLVSSISLGLSNTIPNSLNFNKFAFAQQNPILPNYKAIIPTKMLDNQMGLASNDIQQKSLVHYQPITPAVHDYTDSSNSKSINSSPTLTTTYTINSTSPSSFVQPVSMTQYHPITPTGLTIPIPSPSNNNDNGHTGTNDGSSHHHSSNDNGHNGESHSGSVHHGSSSNHHNSNDHGSHGHGHRGNERDGHSSNHSHGASASASAG